MSDFDPDVLAAIERFERSERQNLPPIDQSVMEVVEEYEKRDRKRQREARMATKKKAQLAYARKELEESYLPSWKAYGVAAGAPIVAGVSRAVGRGKYADAMNRFAGAIEQAQRQREEGGIVPDILQRGVRGAGASLTTMVPAAAVAGPYGAIVAASGQEANRAWTRGKDAGKKGRALTEYAIAQGVVEGAPAAFMQRMGLGGVETLASKRAVFTGVKEGLKRLGISAAQELPEELVTEITHNIADASYGIDPNALSSESLKQTVADTTVQTLLAVGFIGAPGMARAVEADVVAKTTDKMMAHVEEGTVPSRKEWQEASLDPELGKSRKQRRAFTAEVVGQVQQMETAGVPTEEQGITPPTEVEPALEGKPVAPEAPEAAAVEPTAVQEGGLAPEVPEVIEEPGAVTEAPRRPWEMTGEEFSGAYARPALKMKDGKVLTAPRQHLEVIEHQDKYDYDDVAESGWSYEGEYVSEEEMKAEATGKELGWPEAHRVLIRRALERGEHVPAEVLAEYPDLASEAAPEPPRTIDEVPPPEADDFTVALNKAEETQIREEQGLDDLPPLESESARTILSQVLTAKADEKILDTVAEVLKSPRGVEPHEHVAMVVKAGKLMNDQNAALEEQGKAAEAGSAEVFERAVIRSQLIADQLDDITAASKYSGTKISKAFSIRQMRLSRETWDVASLLGRMQAAKGPGARLTRKEKDDTSLTAFELSEIDKRIIEEEGRIRAKEEEKDKALAHKILRANKPRGKVGKRIQERARAKQEEIKEKIRGLGYRVHDITTVSAEGLYLVGRLGLAYGEEGVGSLTDVMEGVIAKLRVNFPEFNLTDHDVYKAFISRSPKEKARARSEAAVLQAQLKTIARLHVEIASLAEGIDLAVKKGKVPVPKEIKKLQEVLDKAREAYYYSGIEAARLERGINRVSILQTMLENGEQRIKQEPKEIPEELAAVNAKARELISQMYAKEQMAKIDRQMKTGIIDVPPRPKKKVVSPELERLRIRLKQKRRDFNKMLANAMPWTPKRVAGEILRQSVEIPRTMMATGEVSFTMRQNALQVAAHPWVAAQSMVPALGAVFSRETADEINNRLETSENGPIYELTKVAIMDSESPDVKLRSDVHRGTVLETLPVLRKTIGSVIRGSARHGVAFSNLMRTRAMDRFIEQNPNATREELNIWANWCNVSTGLGTIKEAGWAGWLLFNGLFSARFTASRIQTPVVMAKAWHLPRVRKAIAMDMTRAVLTGMSFMAMASAIPGVSVMYFWDDPDDPDWGKIRIGNTRFDIWGSFQQPARVIARIVKLAGTRVGLGAIPIKLPLGIGSETYGPVEPWKLFSRFAAFKTSPAITIPSELLTGKTMIGQETTVAGTAARHLTMLFLQDVYDSAKEYENSAATFGTALITGLGVGAATYPDSETTTRNKIKKNRREGNYTEGWSLENEWNATHKRKIRIMSKGS